MRTLILILFLSLLLVPSLASAEDDPALAGLLEKGALELLEEVDLRHNPFDDQLLTTKMIMHGGTNDGDSYQFTTITKGANSRAIRFEEPADMKGMGIVIKGKDEIYVRLPDSKKVRRVGSHAKRQSFQGSDWNFDDMSLIWMAHDYTPEIVEENDTHIHMKLSRKEGVDLSYAVLNIRIDRQYLMIDYIEYVDDEGTALKLQERYDADKIGGDHWIYTRVTMTDLASGHITENQVLKEEINQGVEDKTFSRRWLIRGI